MAKRLPRWSIVVVAACAVAVVALLVQTRPSPEATLRSPPPTRVAVTAVERLDLYPEVTVTGRLQPLRTSALHFEVSGRVAERPVEPGQRVAEGDTLLRLRAAEKADARDRAAARLEEEKAAIARDRRLLELARENRRLQEQEVARQQRLGDSSLASQSQLDAARQALLQLQGEEARLRYSTETAEARLTLRRTELREAQRDLDRTTLEAPFAGTVNAIDVEPGDYVTPAERALQIIDTGALDLYMEVTADTAAALERGQVVTVTAEGQAVDGGVVALQRAPDPETHTYALRVRIPGTGLQPGTLAKVRLPLRPRENALVAPVAAILREEGRAYVFVVQDGKVRRVEVTTGLRDGNRVVLREGPDAGTTIVARDVAALAEGQAVEVAGG